MGGIIAQELALRRPELVRSLVLHCTWGHADPYLAQLIRSWETYAEAVAPLDLSRQIWLWVFTPEYLADEEKVAALERMVSEHPHPQSPDAFSDQAAACVSHDALDRVGEIRAPTLITVGDTDMLAPPRHSLALKERMPRALLHVWPKMGHAPFWEIPDEFNELNRVFLEAN
jgi:pimeloyl-ACP methyl ester carboxylesterase